MHTGAALNSMLEFFQALVKAGLPGLGYRDLLAMLVAPVTHGGSIGSGSSLPVLHKQVSWESWTKVNVFVTCSGYSQHSMLNFLESSNILEQY